MKSYKQFIDETIAQDVLKAGKETGLEHAIVRYRLPGRKILPIIKGTKDTIDYVPHLPDDYDHPRYFDKQKSPHIVVHNHPKDSSLSVADTFQFIRSPELKAMHAVTPAGSIYTATKTKKSHEYIGKYHDDILTAGLGSNRYAREILGDSNHEHFSHLSGMIGNKALQKRGIINFKYYMKGEDKEISDKYHEKIEHYSDILAGKK